MSGVFGGKQRSRQEYVTPNVDLYGEPAAGAQIAPGYHAVDTGRKRYLIRDSHGPGQEEWRTGTKAEYDYERNTTTSYGEYGVPEMSVLTAPDQHGNRYKRRAYETKVESIWQVQQDPAAAKEQEAKAQAEKEQAAKEQAAKEQAAKADGKISAASSTTTAAAAAAAAAAAPQVIPKTTSTPADTPAFEAGETSALVQQQQQITAKESKGRGRRRPRRSRATSDAFLGAGGTTLGA